jgi:hypothetical protein
MTSIVLYLAILSMPDSETSCFRSPMKRWGRNGDKNLSYCHGNSTVFSAGIFCEFKKGDIPAQVVCGKF